MCCFSYNSIKTKHQVEEKWQCLYGIVWECFHWKGLLFPSTAAVLCTQIIKQHCFMFNMFELCLMMAKEDEPHGGNNSCFYFFETFLGVCICVLQMPFCSYKWMALQSLYWFIIEKCIVILSSLANIKSFFFSIGLLNVSLLTIHILFIYGPLLKQWSLEETYWIWPLIQCF